MNKILINESWVNKTEGYRTGESGVYETFTDNKGELYHSLVKEYGRCIGKVYVDLAGETKAIGWVFEKRARYEDTHEPYILETWVSLHESEPVRHTDYKYLYI